MPNLGIKNLLTGTWERFYTGSEPRTRSGTSADADENTTSTLANKRARSNDDSSDDLVVLGDRPRTQETAFRLSTEAVREARRDKNFLTGNATRINRVQQEAGQETTLEERVKRVQSTSFGEERAVKKRKTMFQHKGPGEHEARLFGLGTVPKDAQRIVLPRGSDSEPEEPRVRKTKFTGPTRACGPRPFKIMDTLNDKPFTQPAGSSQGYLRTPYPSIALKRPPKPEDLGSRTSGRIDSAFRGGDGFAPSERQAKRRKAETAVDLAGDYENVPSGDILEHNGKAISPNDNTSKLSRFSAKQSPEVFAAHEIHRLDQYFNMDQPKGRNRRRAARPDRNFLASSQGSSRDRLALYEVDSGGQDVLEGTRAHSSTGVSEIIPRSSHSGIEQKPSSFTTIPRIRLGEGVDLPGKIQKPVEPSRSMPNQSRISISESTSAEHDLSRKQQGVPRDWSEGLHSEPSIELEQAVENKPSLEQPLRSRFERDQGRTTLAARTGVVSSIPVDKTHSMTRVSPIDESEDELTGGNTTLRRGSQECSPKRTPLPRVRSSRLSPSDLRPTQITQIRAMETKPKQLRSVHRGPFREHILSFYSAACYVTSEHDLSLVWDDHEKTIDLYHRDQPKVYDGERRIVSLETNNVQKVAYAPGVNKVHIRGVMTEFSNSHSCIEFATYEGVKWFTDIALEINDNVTLRSTDAKELNAIFKQQSGLLQTLCNQRTVRLGRHESSVKGFGVAQDTAESAEEETILYEPQDEDLLQARRPAKERMELNGLPTFESRLGSRHVDEKKQTVSPYFSEPTRRPTRQSQAAQKRLSPPPLERWTQVHNPERWSQPVLYPPQGGINTATVEFRDLKTLDETEFLNDNIIAFALRQIQDKMKPEHRQQVHFFNSFFYATLTTKNGKKSPCNFDAVKRWTRKADILSKPFIIVPINVDLHWFVAIICNVDQLSRKVANMEDEIDLTTATYQPSPANNETPPRTSPAHASPEGTQHMPAGDGSLFEEGETAYDGETVKLSRLANGKKLKKRAAPPLRRYETSQPIVITLDSLGGSHPAELRNLKDYIVAEAQDKREISISRDAIAGMNVKDLPEQSNFCDCGLYLVGYVDQFAKNPRQFIDRILSRRELDRQSEFARFDPSKKRAEIRDELLKLNIDQENARNMRKKQKMAVRKDGTSTESTNHVGLSNTPEELDPTMKNDAQRPVLPAQLLDESSLVEIASLPVYKLPTVQADDVDTFDELEIEPPQALDYTRSHREAAPNAQLRTDLLLSTNRHPADVKQYD